MWEKGGVVLSGGNSSKRYLLSSLQFRLSLFLLICFLNPNNFVNKSYNFESVTDKFLFNNILLIINEVVGFTLFICSNAKDSGLCAKDLIEQIDLFKLKYLGKDIAEIELNSIRLANMK